MKLLLIDGHYYAYRSFFAIQGLRNSRGEPTNAIYGFLTTLRRMLKHLAPDLAAVCWDDGLPARRTEMQPEYKQQRPDMPSDLRLQLKFIQDELVPMLGFPGLRLPDTEADDLMAAYACAARRRGDEVVIATNDKDLFQLVDDRVRIYSTNKTDLAAPRDTHALLGTESVRAKWGVEPEQIGDVLALIGDSVDNIPGIPGMGLKTASALVAEHGGIEQLLAGLASVKKPALRAKLEAGCDQIRQNREMVRLETDLPLPTPLDGLTITPRWEELIAALERCEFKGVVAEIRAEVAGQAVEVPTPCKQGELF